MDKHLFIHRVCKVLHYQHYYENNYGIKVHNKKNMDNATVCDNISIDPNTVFLGFDGLKDEYTLLDTCINESPHFDLIKRLNCNESISDCDYVVREKKGTLDGRYEIPVPDHKQFFDKSKESVLSGKYKPALIYCVDGRRYVLDGKHRLSVCSLLGLKCNCAVLNLEAFKKDIHTNRLYTEMKKKTDYSKNVLFLEKLLGIT